MFRITIDAEGIGDLAKGFCVHESTALNQLVLEAPRDLRELVREQFPDISPNSLTCMTIVVHHNTMVNLVREVLVRHARNKIEQIGGVEAWRGLLGNLTSERRL